MNDFLVPLLWKACIFMILLFIVLLTSKLIYYKITKKSMAFGKSTANTIKGSGLKKSKNGEGFIFGLQGKNEVYLENSKEGHITVFGGSGLGKTSALLIPSLRKWNAPFFAIDISGDISKNVKVAKEKMIIIEPENPYESAAYNIFYLIDRAKEEAEKRLRLEQLVMQIIEIPQNTNDTNLYFLETARKILLAAFIAFYDIGMDFTEICKTVFFSSIADLVNIIAETDNELAMGYIKPLLSENEKNISGAKGTLNNKIKIFADNENMEIILRRSCGSSRNFFYPEMLEEKRVFLKVSDKKQEYYAPFVHIVVAQILEYISGRTYEKGRNERILLALDEFVSMGYFDVLAPFRKFRKNGCNLCILTQSLADIDLVYSEKERKVILDNSRYIAVLSATDNSTREYFSNLIGKQEVKKKSTSTGKGGSSTSISSSKEYIIEPEEWKNLGEELIVIHQSGFLRLKKNYYYK
ncbi:MAG: type IV secretory system conjugative DNA transfer family protein [Eubacterium sp.]|nr:type IV secretory system conjugative DNA transfer family protein [Eubacterium sp.]